MINKKMTQYELKYQVESIGSRFFDRGNMKFAGDTMRNYGIGTCFVLDRELKKVECWQLFRRKSVKFGLRDSAYFDKKTYKQVWGTPIIP